MPVKVYGGKGKSGPTEQWAKTTCANLNRSNHKWSVTYQYTNSRTVFTATGATDQELETAVTGYRPGGCYVGICS
jgi:hypothetical protein